MHWRYARLVEALRRLTTVAAVACACACGTLLEIGEDPTTADVDAAGPTQADGMAATDARSTAEAGMKDSAAPDAPRGKLVFVTTAKRSGDLGGLDGGDALCNAEAKSSGLTTRFVAYLHAGGGDTGHPGHRLTDAGWSRSDGTVAFTTNPHFQRPLAPLALTADGAALGAGELVWTGVYNGPLSNCGPNDAAIWTSTTAQAIPGGGIGDPLRNDEGWESAGKRDCTELLHVYCFEQ